MVLGGLQGNSQLISTPSKLYKLMKDFKLLINAALPALVLAISLWFLEGKSAPPTDMRIFTSG